MSPRARRLCRREADPANPGQRRPHPAAPGRSLCAEHQRQAEVERGSRQARGYDTAYDHARRAWAPIVARGNATCWRCKQRIDPAEPWVLGHDDHDRSIIRGPEHQDGCNARAAGLAAHGREWTPRELGGDVMPE